MASNPIRRVHSIGFAEKESGQRKALAVVNESLAPLSISESAGQSVGGSSNDFGLLNNIHC